MIIFAVVKPFMFIFMKTFIFRLFKLLVMSLGFPVLFISLLFAVVLIPFCMFFDCFYYLFTGSFRIADDYISLYFHEVAFRWYYILENFLNKYL